MVKSQKNRRMVNLRRSCDFGGFDGLGMVAFAPLRQFAAGGKNISQSRPSDEPREFDDRKSRLFAKLLAGVVADGGVGAA